FPFLERTPEGLLRRSHRIERSLGTTGRARSRALGRRRAWSRARQSGDLGNRGIETIRESAEVITSLGDERYRSLGSGVHEQPHQGCIAFSRDAHRRQRIAFVRVEAG